MDAPSGQPNTMSSPATTVDASASIAPPSKLRLALILGALSGLGPLSIDMYLPSFPSIARSLGTDVAAVQFTLATYLAGLTLGQLVYGPLSDRIGRRAPLLGGLALYTVASLLCAFTPSLPLLAAGRFLQALGGCAGMVISRAVVRDHLDERSSAQMYSSLMLVMGVAPILAPLLGGQVLAMGGWRSIFWVLALASAALFAVIFLGLGESHPPERRERLNARAIVATAGRVLRTPSFLRVALVGGLMQTAMFAYITGSPFVLIELFEVPAERFGFIFGANAMGLIAGSQLNRVLVARHGVAKVLRGAVYTASVAALGLAATVWLDAGLAPYLAANFVVIASLGFVLPNSTALAMAPFSAGAGIASAVLGSLQSASGAIGSALVSALATGTAWGMVIVIAGGTLLAASLVSKATRDS